MTYKPRTVDEAYQSIRDKLTDRIESLTNFTETSFNYVWTRAFARRFREAELALLAVQLSGWADYAGGPITEEDLDDLDIDGVDPDEVNKYMNDEDLDRLAQLVGIDRSEGEFATGTVTFTTQSRLTTIPADTRVGTQPDQNNEFLEFRTDEEVESPSGQTEVQADVTAVDVGEEYNVGAVGGGSGITYLPNPPTGVQSVENNQAMDGGESPEENDQFRERVKEAIFSTSGGGTALGVEGFVQNEVENVLAVNVKEYPGGNDSLATDSPSPGGPGGSNSTTPFGDVIVQGEASDSDIQDAIDQARPVAIQHNLVRPNFVEVSVSAEVEADAGVEASDIEDSLTKFLSSRELGEDVYRDKIIQRIMNVSNSVNNINTLSVRIENETHIYDSDNSGGDAPNHPLYKLNKGDVMQYDSTADSNDATSSGISDVTGVFNGTSDTTFTEGSDFDEGTVDGSSPDAIDWSVGGDSPDEDEEFNVDYFMEDDVPINDYEKATPGNLSDITIV